MNKRRFAGRKLLFWSSALLLGWAGYEFWVRFDAVRWMLEGLVNLCVHEGIPFERALSYFDASMFYIMVYLLGLAVLSLIAFIARNRPGAGYFLIPACIAAAILGNEQFQWFNFHAFEWMQWIKLVPLALIVIGYAINMAQYYVIKYKDHAQAKDRIKRQKNFRNNDQTLQG